MVFVDKKHALGALALNGSAQEYLAKLASFLEAKAYSPMTNRNYMALTRSTLDMQAAKPKVKIPFQIRLLEK